MPSVPSLKRELRDKLAEGAAKALQQTLDVAREMHPDAPRDASLGLSIDPLPGDLGIRVSLRVFTRQHEARRTVEIVLPIVGNPWEGVGRATVDAACELVVLHLGAQPADSMH